MLTPIWIRHAPWRPHWQEVPLRCCRGEGPFRVHGPIFAESTLSVSLQRSVADLCQSPPRGFQVSLPSLIIFFSQFFPSTRYQPFMMSQRPHLLPTTHGFVPTLWYQTHRLPYSCSRPHCQNVEKKSQFQQEAVNRGLRMLQCILNLHFCLWCWIHESGKKVKLSRNSCAPKKGQLGGRCFTALLQLFIISSCPVHHAAVPTTWTEGTTTLCSVEKRPPCPVID